METKASAAPQSETTWWNDDSDSLRKAWGESDDADLQHQARITSGIAIGLATETIRVQLESDEHGNMLLHGQPSRLLGLCNYLGLDKHPRMIEAVCEATRRYGTYFSVSTQYLRHPLYLRAQSALEQVLRRPCLLTKSAGLANASFFNSIIRLDKGCGVLMDRSVHASVQTVSMAQAGVVSALARTSVLDMNGVEKELIIMVQQKECPRVWLATDGVFSMTGVTLNYQAVLDMQAKHPQLWVFCDDAHGTGWSGADGRGAVVDAVLRIADDAAHQRHQQAKRWVFSIALSKALSADGGALVLPSASMRAAITSVSPFSIFTSFLSLPSLASIAEAAKMCTDGTVAALQTQLRNRVDLALQERQQFLTRHGIEDTTPDPERQHNKDTPHAPIILVPVGYDVLGTCRIVAQLHNQGYYVSPIGPPAMRGSGIRMTVTATTPLQDIKDVFAALSAAMLGKTAQSTGTGAARVVAEKQQHAQPLSVGAKVCGIKARSLFKL